MSKRKAPVFTKTSLALIALVLLAHAVLPEPAHQTQWKGSIAEGSGVEIVRNPSTPMYPNARLDLEEEYIIGPSNIDGSYSFVQPTRLLVNKQGELFVCDIRDHNVKVFDRHGQFIRIIGRQGQGPGELIGPSQMSLLGDELAVYCSQLRRITIFDAHGRYARSFHCPLTLRQTMDSHGNVFAAVPVRDKQGIWMIDLQKFDPSLNYVKTLMSNEEKPHHRFAAVHCMEVGPHDEVIYGYPDMRYEFFIFDKDGDLVRIIRKDGPRIRVPHSEVKYLISRFKSYADSTTPDAEETYPFFRTIHPDDQGRYMVRTHELFSEKIDFYDVFSPDGKFLAQVSTPHSNRPLWTNNRFYTLVEDEEGFLVVKVYRARLVFD